MDHFDEIDLQDCPCCGGVGNIEVGGGKLEPQEGHLSRSRRVTHQINSQYIDQSGDADDEGNRHLSQSVCMTNCCVSTSNSPSG